MNYFDEEVATIVKHAECVLGVKYVSAFSMTVYNGYAEEAFAAGEDLNHTTTDLIEAIERALDIKINRKTFKFVPRFFEDQDDTGVYCVTWRLLGK